MSNIYHFFQIVTRLSVFYRFDIFSFLVQFVHRDGMIGEQARDSLLLCMSISKNNDKIADYITSKSNICPVRKFCLMRKYVSSIPDEITQMLLVRL